MIDSLPTLDGLYVLAIVIWGIYYSWRLKQHSKDPVFLKMPWLMLWANAYVFGLCHMVNNYSVQVRLEVFLFSYTDFPFVIILKLTLFSLVYFMFFENLRFYSPYHKAWYKEIILLVAYLLSCMLVAIRASYSPPYQELYWFSNLLICSNAFIALLLLISPVRKYIKDYIPTVEYIHLIWFVVCVGLAAGGVAFTMISALNGLITNRDIVADLAQHIAYVLNTLSLIAMMVLTSPDSFIYVTGFPIQLQRLMHFDQLLQYILSATKIREVFPLSDYRTVENIDHAIYERVVSILDYYPFLESENELYKSLVSVERQSETYHDCVELLSRVRIPKV